MVKIVIDPGHGGPSVPAKVGGSSWNNATGPGGTLEKTVTLKVGKAVKAAFSGSPVTVVMTRETDVNLGIVARAKKAKDIGAEAFVSIHFNAAPSSGPRAQGTETWIGDSPTPHSRDLANRVQAAVVAVTGLRNRGVKVGNVSGVIKNTNHADSTAHCLVEISFLDRQPEEEARLADATYVSDLGRAIRDAIMQYLADAGLVSDAVAEIDDDDGLASSEPEDAASAMAGNRNAEFAFTASVKAPDRPNDAAATFARVPFIDDRADDRPFADLKGRSSVDDPAKMLRGWTETTMFEVAVAEWNTVPSALLHILSEKRRAVARIEVPGAPGLMNFLNEPAPNGWHGTAFLVGDNLLLTNHHVLHSIAVARSAVAEFDFELAAGDLFAARTAQPAPKRIKLNPERLFITSPATGGGLDYTFVWIEDAAKEFGVIPMQRASFTVNKFDPVFIIHHPRGRLKEASLDDTEALRIKSTVIHYAADTDFGSSGSPVFDRSGRLIALHHARNGDGPERLQDGRTVDMLNEGVKISAIALDLENRIARGDGATAAGEVLSQMGGSDTLSGFFGALGRPAGSGTDVEAVVDTYQGTENDLDIGFWNIEWLANRWRDQAKLDGAATVIADLNLDIWSLIEVSPAAVRALVDRLNEKFGENYKYDLSEPDASESKQSTAVIWKPRLVEGGKIEWPEPIRSWWDLDSRDDLPFEAVDGKIFNRYPARYRFSLKGRDRLAPFTFNLVPLHLKAMAEGSKRRRLASLLLARAVERLSSNGSQDDWIIGGDVNDDLASGDFDELIDAGLKPMSAADEEAGAFTYLKSPKSLIDNVFLSPNITRTTGGADYFIVAKEKSVSKYVKQISDHRPVVARFSLGNRGSEADVRALADRITSPRKDYLKVPRRRSPSLAR